MNLTYIIKNHSIFSSTTDHKTHKHSSSSPSIGTVDFPTVKDCTRSTQVLGPPPALAEAPLEMLPFQDVPLGVPTWYGHTTRVDCSHSVAKNCCPKLLHLPIHCENGLGLVDEDALVLVAVGLLSGWGWPG